VHLKICEICGGEFTSRFVHKKTCSKKCNRIRLNIYQNANKIKNHGSTKRENCKNCGEKITALGKRLYCSEKCEHQFYYKHSPVGKNVCKFCEKEFKPNRRNQIFCSPDCRKNCKKERDAKFYEDKNGTKWEGSCRTCGKELDKGVGGHLRYCSKKCKGKYERKNRIKYEKQCVVCNKWFKTPNKTTILCSPACINTYTKKNEDVILVCEYCKEEFLVPFQKRNTRKFCSLKCIHSVERVRSPEYRERLSEACSQRFLDGKYDGVRRGKFKTGLYFSPKLNEEIAYRSSWEKIAYESLDRNERVLAYIPEPFSIEYKFGGITRRYIPDILISYSDGVTKLVEIKPKDLLKRDKKILAKNKAARRYCKKNGYLFEVWTEDRIYKMNAEIILDIPPSD